MLYFSAVRSFAPPTPHWRRRQHQHTSQAAVAPQLSNRNTPRARSLVAIGTRNLAQSHRALVPTTSSNMDAIGRILREKIALEAARTTRPRPFQHPGARGARGRDRERRRASQRALAYLLSRVCKQTSSRTLAATTFASERRTKRSAFSVTPTRLIRAAALKHTQRQCAVELAIRDVVVRLHSPHSSAHAKFAFYSAMPRFHLSTTRICSPTQNAKR